MLKKIHIFSSHYGINAKSLQPSSCDKEMEPQVSCWVIALVLSLSLSILKPQKGLNQPGRSNSFFVDNPKEETHEMKGNVGNEDDFVPKFFDEGWKNGTRDLNMFVKNGKMDWDGVIVAEARRRRFLEIYPQVSTNEEPIVFRGSIIPWWVWIMHSHLPEFELLNGRAAMGGFFVAYFADTLTGLDVVDQTGNFICKVFGILLFQKEEDLGTLKGIANEATFYDKQWQASWQDEDHIHMYLDSILIEFLPIMQIFRIIVS